MLNDNCYCDTGIENQSFWLSFVDTKTFGRRWEESTHRLRLDEHVRISLDVICCTIFNKTVTVLGTRKITVDNFYFHCLPIRVKL